MYREERQTTSCFSVAKFTIVFLKFVSTVDQPAPDTAKQMPVKPLGVNVGSIDYVGSMSTARVVTFY